MDVGHEMSPLRSLVGRIHHRRVTCDCQSCSVLNRIISIASWCCRNASGRPQAQHGRSREWTTHLIAYHLRNDVCSIECKAFPSEYEGSFSSLSCTTGNLQLSATGGDPSTQPRLHGEVSLGLGNWQRLNGLRCWSKRGMWLDLAGIRHGPPRG
jgi:hypothetical protein